MFEGYSVADFKGADVTIHYRQGRVRAAVAAAPRQPDDPRRLA